MFSAFKKIFGAPKTKSAPAPVESYAEWCMAHPDDAKILAAERPRGRHMRCHRHDADLVTTLGYRSRMDCLASGSFMDAAAENPFCLDVEEHRHPLATSNPTRLIFCAACEAGMRARLG